VKMFRLPEKIKALAFDMDLTLYTNPEYAQYQTDSLIEKLARLRNLSFDEMKRDIEDTRKKYESKGKTLSFSKTLNSFGISTKEIAALRNEILEPERFIKEDFELKKTLWKLAENYYLGLVTNNPVLVAIKTIAALGVAEHFPIIVGLDTCMTPKPHKKPYMKFVELSACAAEECVSIGDRYDVDLDVPIKMGMGGILVDGVEDVYKLQDILLKGGNYGL